MPPDYQCLVANTVTGRIVDELPMADYSWTDSLDLARGGNMTITSPLLGGKLTDDRSALVRARSVASGHWYLSLVLVRDEQPLWAGPLVTHSVAADRSTVQFGCTSIAKLLDARVVLASGFELTPGATGADVPLASSQFGVAVKLLTMATTGSNRGLPLTIPADTGIGGDSRTYVATDLASVLSRLTQLSQETGGPDIRFRPVLDINQTQLSWAVDIGTPRLGLVNSPWAWDYPTSIVSITEDGDASNMSFRGYVPGNAGGWSATPPVGVAQDLTKPAAGWPMLERTTRMAGSVQELAVLNRQAASFVAANTTAALTWKITVDPEAFPVIGSWAFGDNATFTIVGDSWIPDGVYQQRLIGVTHTQATAALETSSVLVSP